MLRMLLLAVLALACVVLAGDASQSCLDHYGASHQSAELCPISDTVAKDLARNCTDGNVPSVHAALAAFCNLEHREDASDIQDVNDRTLEDTPSSIADQIVIRRPSNQRQPSPDAAGKPAVEAQQWQSSSVTYKHHSWAFKPTSGSDSMLSNIFAERAVRFALSGLLLTTLTSFIFL